MEYCYSTEFKLNGAINDFKDASKYLTEDDITKYLREDIINGRYESLKGFPPDNILSLVWILDDDDRGHVELHTSQPLDEKQLMDISSYVCGQNSDGLGEGFEQQDFANYLDRDAYQDALDDYEMNCDRIEEDVRAEYEDNDDYTDDDIEDEIQRRINEECEEPCEDDYYECASFDWDTNRYIFKDVTDYEKINTLRHNAVDTFYDKTSFRPHIEEDLFYWAQKSDNNLKSLMRLVLSDDAVITDKSETLKQIEDKIGYVWTEDLISFAKENNVELNPENPCMIYFENSSYLNYKSAEDFIKDLDNIFNEDNADTYAFIINAEKVICEGPVCDRLKSVVSTKLNGILKEDKNHSLSNER